MKVLVYCSGKYKWLMPAFTYLFNKYWSEMQEVVVLGFGESPELPDNFEWVMGAEEDPGAKKWTNPLIHFLEQWEEDYFTFLLEDYLISRMVDVRAIGSLGAYIQTQPDVLRIDLTADRLHSGGAIDIGAYGTLDIIDTPRGVPYRASLQAAIYNKKNWLKCLSPDMGPWDVELGGDGIIPEDQRVLGTRNKPLTYLNACGMQLPGEYKYRTIHTREGLGGVTIEKIEQEHLTHMLENGLLPEGGYHG